MTNFRNSIYLSVINKSYWLLFWLFISCFNAKTNKPEDNVSSQSVSKVDSFFFKTSNSFEIGGWQLSNKDSANILRVYSNEYVKDHFWSNSENNLMHLKVLAEGKLKKPRGTDLKAAKAFGKWLFYGDVDIGLYKIGHYKSGLKDSIWYKSYEDYPIPEIKFYRNGVSIDYNQPIIINEPGLVKASGSALSKNGVPLGKWTFVSDSTLQTTYHYTVENDSILVKFSTINTLNNKIIDTGEFQEILEY